MIGFQFSKVNEWKVNFCSFIVNFGNFDLFWWSVHHDRRSSEGLTTTMVRLKGRGRGVQRQARYYVDNKIRSM